MRILRPTGWSKAGKLDVGYPIHRIPNGVNVEWFGHKSSLDVYEYLGILAD